MPDVFLQILDAARVTMTSGASLDLGGFHIVLTSDLGAAEILNLQHSSFTTMERHVPAKARRTLDESVFPFSKFAIPRAFRNNRPMAKAKPAANGREAVPHFR